VINFMAILNQIIAVEKGVKSRTCNTVTETHKANQKPDLFNGFVKVYRKKDEEGEDFPQEKKIVQLTVEDSLNKATKALTELFDISATKDWANCNATADVVLNNGNVLIAKAPVPFLLFMEKEVNDIRTLIENLPVLDSSENWTKDDNSGLYKTESTPTHKTKKAQRPIVLSEATKEHPAQTQLIVEDVIVGYWDTVKHSGAIPAPRKKAILERVEEFSKAIKFAREEANASNADSIELGKRIFDFLLA
jgi:hypothetical protein